MRAGAAIALAVTACAAEGPPVDRFDPDRVIEIDVELPADAWAELRAQTRRWTDVYTTCLREPFASPYTWFDAEVRVDGARYAGARVKKRGFLGSLSVDKPSLRIDLGEDVDLVLNNAVQDASYVRQCLAYRTFAAAGIPAPRCNYAHVTVGGEDLGVYVHVERIDRDFVARHFDDAGGTLYEGTYSDFRAGWTATFEPAAGSEVDALVGALARPDDELVEAVDAELDVDELVRFWAAEVLVGHRDGFAGNANNYFAYRDARFHLIPWGADRTFLGAPPVVLAGSQAPWRLYQLPDTRALYEAALRELLDTAWDEDALLAEIDRVAPLLPAGDALDDVRAFVRGRRAAILAALDAEPVTPTLDDPPCAIAIGAVSGALADGTGTIEGTLDDVRLDVTSVRATVADGRLTATASLGDGTTLYVVMPLDGSTGVVQRYTPETAAFSTVGQLADVTLALSDDDPVRATFEASIIQVP